jgi:hypothetical protein
MTGEIDLSAPLKCPSCQRENTLSLRASDPVETPDPACRAALDLCSCGACERACYFVRLDLETAAGVLRHMFGPFNHGETGTSGNLWRNAAAALIARVWPVLAADSAGEEN